MKTRINVAVWCVMVGIMLSACGGSKKAASPEPDEVEIVTPFSNVKSDKQYIRAVASGKSLDLNVAKKMAMANAQSQIATSIQTKFDEVALGYIKQYGQNEDIDLGQNFQDMYRIVVKQVLSNINASDSKTFRNSKTNMYTYWVVVEMAKSDVGQQLIKGVSDSAKNKIDFNQAQYEKIFNEALDKM